ncbi:glycosyltransferase [Mucilaginibacter sp. AW1-7]|jgi:GT2 family glycosyltransferase|uniref:glycosyltransferase n=1 Tax=Mucilaginibacter sp. AW1-7 TaxID=3349874 RepID=UPI003F737DD2
MSGLENSVCILTVTYGDRWRFLEKVLKRVLAYDQITQVIVIDNASAYSVTDEVKKLEDSRIIVISNTENTGSAGGYKTAIEHAVENTQADFFFLLDDDNLPGADVLTKLLTEWQSIEGADNKKALFCLREDRIQHVKIAKGENSLRYLTFNDFMGFNVFRILANQYRKLNYKFQKDGPYKSRVQMPYVPYGGLLLHRTIINDIGFPDERLFLYVDDSEYTYRITKNKGIIWLIPLCKIVDIDKSQGLDYKRRPFHSHLLDQWNFRTYYHVRNRMFFYSNNFISNMLVFKLNKGLYLSYLKVISLISSKREAYSKLLVAIKDGLGGKLGKAGNEKF